jgi:hypothetical protein
MLCLPAQQVPPGESEGDEGRSDWWASGSSGCSQDDDGDDGGGEAASSLPGSAWRRLQGGGHLRTPALLEERERRPRSVHGAYVGGRWLGWGRRHGRRADNDDEDSNAESYYANSYPEEENDSSWRGGSSSGDGDGRTSYDSDGDVGGGWQTRHMDRFPAGSGFHGMRDAKGVAEYSDDDAADDGMGAALGRSGGGAAGCTCGPQAQQAGAVAGGDAWDPVLQGSPRQEQRAGDCIGDGVMGNRAWRLQHDAACSPTRDGHGGSPTHGGEEGPLELPPEVALTRRIAQAQLRRALAAAGLDTAVER